MRNPKIRGQNVQSVPKEFKSVYARIDALSRDHLNAFGVDPFGFDPESLKAVMPLAVWLYQKYFRCEAHGLENIPDGRILQYAQRQQAAIESYCGTIGGQNPPIWIEGGSIPEMLDNAARSMAAAAGLTSSAPLGQTAN